MQEVYEPTWRIRVVCQAAKEAFKSILRDSRGECPLDEAWDECSSALTKHYEHIKTSLLQGGLDSPLNWYISNLRGVNNGIIASTSDGTFCFQRRILNLH